MGVVRSLRLADLAEMAVGLASVIRVLGLRRATPAIGSAVRQQWRALRRGEGRYPEPGKRRIWFKLYFVKGVYEYLLARGPEEVGEELGRILEAPARYFLGRFAPPRARFDREFTLHFAWQEFLRRDYNLVAEVQPPQGSSVSLRVTRCFIHEVVSEIGLTPVAPAICRGDYVFWGDYHPQVLFSRDKTLLQGDGFCNHTLTWIESGESPPSAR